MPGKPVTNQQVRLYMQDRSRHSQRIAAAQSSLLAGNWVQATSGGNRENNSIRNAR